MDIFDTRVLNGVVYYLTPKVTFLSSRYFPVVQTEESEEIHFDKVTKKLRLAPFVSPMVEGKIVKSQGYTTDSFRPAYIKDKRPFDPTKPIKRLPGEAINGELSPEQRLDILVRNELTDQLEMLDARFEWMAAQILLTGKVIISGEDYPTKEVDFGRTAGLTTSLGGGSRWGESGVNPLDDLQDWATAVNDAAGTEPIDVIMTPDVWKVFRKDPEVKDRLDRRRVDQTIMSMAASFQPGAAYKGEIDGFQIYTYRGRYWDEDTSAHVSFLPDKTVIMTSSELQGVKAFGAIKDLKSLKAQPYFVKSWEEEDPSVRMLLMQSAPLLVPYRVDASTCVTTVIP